MIIIKQEEKQIEVVKQYISQVCSDVTDYQDAIAKIKMLISYFEIKEHDLYLLINLLYTNATLYRVVKLIFEQYQKYIRSGYTEGLFEDEILVSLLKSYSDLNDIKLAEAEKLEIQVTKTESWYLRQIVNIPLLTYEEERALGFRILAKDEIAKKKLVEHNLRLVVNIAKQYQNRGLSFMDLIQEGNLGLVRAAERFDVTRNIKFSTYANCFIHGVIKNAIRDHSQIFKSSSVLPKFKAMRTELQMKLGRYPTDTELAQELEISITSVKKLNEMSLYECISLDTLVGDNEKTSLGELIDSGEEDPFDQVFRAEIPNYVRQLLKNSGLSKRELEILKYRYWKQQSLSEIGKQYGVTKQNIARIENDALKKLRKCYERSNRVRNF